MIIAAVLALILTGCSDGPSQSVSLSGSSTVAPLAQALGSAFEARHQGIEVDVQAGGSSRGINDAVTELVDIGMASRALRPDDPPLNSYTIAHDGITLITHRDNPVTSLSTEAVQRIYRGETTNWQELGGPDRPIVVVHKAEGRSTLELFLEHFKLNNRQVEPDVVIGGNHQGIKTVAGNRGAIGYVSIGTAQYEADQGAAIRLLPMGGITPTFENVAEGRFPLTRPLNLLVKGTPQEWEKAFIDFARSAEARDHVLSHFFVPANPARR
ncbi:ABC transporter substrate-binding protein [Tamilnaduibacter salinus]|uniref:ABC transporter substrate-binding protein n=2 Tax=Tamilnaduibacter salinus TaxID=1484056 RepID=A0A2A2I3Z3_9GAMM|nr:ABC transporter substrate-binding protein [Tamilnaduibacter salinus]